MRMFAIVVLTATMSLSLPGQSTISVKRLLSENTLPHYTPSEIKQMIRNAKTADDFERLADYFDRRAMEYETKSQSEELELSRLLALPFHARSYATQVENTRNRIDHFKALFHNCSEQAAMYRERAQGGEMTKPAKALPTCL